MKNVRSFLRGLYYIIFSPSKGFIKEKRGIRNKYYSTEAPKKQISETTIVFMIDGRSVHGGLTDRLRGIASIYQYCKRRKIRFKLNHIYPFCLSDYLEKESVDWQIEEDGISYNIAQTTVILLNDYQLDVRLHRIYLDAVVRKNKGKQIHVYSNTCFFDEYFSQSFRELFVPTLPLIKSIEANLQHIGNKYIAMVFRFQQLLGDFKEDGYKTLSEKEQAVLIEKCISKVEEIQKEKHLDTIVLVTSDSGRFLQTIVSRLDYVCIIPGKVVHMDHTDNAAFDTYMKSFVDLFLLAKADKIYLLQTGDMYHSGFAQRAAMINDRPYEEVIF